MGLLARSTLQASLTTRTELAVLLFPILSFDDESELWVKSVGTAKVEGNKTRFVGTLTVVGGKGRFADAKGDGSLNGTRYTPLAVGADLVSDYTINLRSSRA